MYKILIADTSPALCCELKRLLSGEYAVWTCEEPENLPALLQYIQPDIFVVELLMAGCDGIELIKTAYAAGIRPQIIATCTYASPFVLQSLQQLQISCLLQKPCSAKAIAGKILDLQWYQQDPTADTDLLRYEISSALTCLGFCIYSNGGKCLVEAILCFLRNPNQFITKELYPTVAMTCGGSPARVERAIRDCIRKAWEQRDEAVWRMFFPAGRDGKVAHMCNTDFISRIAYRIRDCHRYKYAQNL